MPPTSVHKCSFSHHEVAFVSLPLESGLAGDLLWLIECRSDILRIPNLGLRRPYSTCFRSWKPATLQMSDYIIEWWEATREITKVPRHWKWGHLSSLNPSWVTSGDTIRRERPSQLSAVQAIPAEATDITEQRGAIHTEPCLNSWPTETWANKMVLF